MAWNLIASGSAASGDTISAVVGALNCVGADLIVGVVSGYGGTLANGDLTDDSANSYTLRMQQASNTDGSLWSALFYVLNPTVDSAMTFTFDRGGNVVFPSMVLYAFSGLAASPMITSAGSGMGSTSAQAGSIGSADDLMVEGLAWYPNDGMSIDSGFSTPIEIPDVSSVNVGCAGSYKFVAGAENPTWTWSGSNAVSATAIAFTGTGGGGGNPWYYYAQQ